MRKMAGAAIDVTVYLRICQDDFARCVKAVAQKQLAVHVETFAVDLAGIAAVQIELRHVGRMKMDSFRYCAVVQHQCEWDADIREVEAADDTRAEKPDSSGIDYRNRARRYTQPSNEGGADVSLRVPVGRVRRVIGDIERICAHTRYGKIRARVVLDVGILQ